MSALDILKLIAISVVAVAVLDLWQRLFHRLGGLPPTNWAVVGRWLKLLLRDRIFVNTQLQTTPAMPGEAAAGWLLHYGIGVVYVFAFYLLWQPLNLLAPTWQDGVLFGVLSVVIPWFFFMPALGAGVLAHKTPRPMLACTAALLTHTVFGLAIAVLMAIVF